MTAAQGGDMRQPGPLAAPLAAVARLAGQVAGG